MKLKPLEDRVVVKLITHDEKTASGIIIPSAVQNEEASQIAEVVCIGDKLYGPHRVLNVGDKVVYKKYAGTDVQLDKENYTVVSIDDIIAVIEM